MTINQQIETTYQIIRKFGISRNVISFLAHRRAQKMRDQIRFKHKKLAQPIYFRGGSELFHSDFHCFDTIFLYDAYGVSIDFQPQVIFDCGANIGMAAVYLRG